MFWGEDEVFSFRHTEVESASDSQVEMLSRDVDTRVRNLLCEEGWVEGRHLRVVSQCINSIQNPETRGGHMGVRTCRRDTGAGPGPFHGKRPRRCGETSQGD